VIDSPVGQCSLLGMGKAAERGRCGMDWVAALALVLTVVVSWVARDL